MVEEPLLGLRADGVDPLHVRGRAKGGDCQSLRLAAGEKPGTLSPRLDANLDRNRQDLAAAPAAPAEATGAQTTKAATEPAGRNLLPVLAVRTEAVDEVVAAMFPEMSNHAVRSVTDSEGWVSGFSPADRAALHVGGGLLG